MARNANSATGFFNIPPNGVYFSSDYSKTRPKRAFSVRACAAFVRWFALETSVSRASTFP